MMVKSKSNTRTLKLMNRHGAVKDKIKVDYHISDMALTWDGEILITDSNCIKSISREKKISILFATNLYPSGLCCLHNGDIVVAFSWEGKVIVYSKDGQIRQTIDDIKFRHPMRVAANKVNQDIYVCDHEKHSYDSAGKVFAVRAERQLRYEYTGQGHKPLNPVAVCSDQMGFVLITDYCNKRVEILDQKGQFIRYILTSEHGLDKPITIDVDGDGYVWIGEYGRVVYKGCVKVARYRYLY